MCESRQRAEWLRTGISVAFIVNRNGWNTQPISPLAVIPEQFRPAVEAPPELSAEEREQESRIAWGMLDRAFGGRAPKVEG